MAKTLAHLKRIARSHDDGDHDHCDMTKCDAARGLAEPLDRDTTLAGFYRALYAEAAKRGTDLADLLGPECPIPDLDQLAEVEPSTVDRMMARCHLPDRPPRDQ